jgi:hypothetical protein
MAGPGGTHQDPVPDAVLPVPAPFVVVLGPGVINIVHAFMH